MLKNVLLITAKNALNVVLVTGPAMVWDSGHFTIHSHAGLQHICELMLNLIIAREAAVWGPVLLRWTTTNADAPKP